MTAANINRIVLAVSTIKAGSPDVMNAEFVTSRLVSASLDRRNQNE
jgi:hypothetical protein